MQANKYKNCQSCGMPLKKDNEKEHDYYCSNCYKNGGFVEPDLTREEMEAKIFDILREMKFPKFIANSYVKKIQKLERWK